MEFEMEVWTKLLTFLFDGKLAIQFEPQTQPVDLQ